MNETNYRIKFKRGDFEVEVQGDQKFVEEKFKELTEGKLLVPEEIMEKREVLTLSLGEFLRAKGNPTTHTNITMVFAYWLFKKERMVSFNRKDIEKCYTNARISKPANITDIMNTNQGKGLLDRAPEKKDGLKAWVITRTGEEYVEKELSP